MSDIEAHDSVARHCLPAVSRGAIAPARRNLPGRVRTSVTAPSLRARHNVCHVHAVAHCCPAEVGVLDVAGIAPCAHRAPRIGARRTATQPADSCLQKRGGARAHKHCVTGRVCLRQTAGGAVKSKGPTQGRVFPGAEVYTCRYQGIAWSHAEVGLTGGGQAASSRGCGGAMPGRCRRKCRRRLM